MSNSLRQHSAHEVQKQLRLRIKRNGLDQVDVSVTKTAGKLHYNFSGLPEQVVKAEAILAAW